MTAPERPPAPANLLEAFEWRVRTSPDARFVITLDGAERTYADVDARDHALAAAVHAAAADRPGPVGIYLANTPGWVVAMLASWRCGRAMAACGRLLSKSEAQRNLELAGAAVVVTDHPDDFAGLLPVVAVDTEGCLLDRDEHTTDRTWSAAFDRDDVAAIFFTSGTTGAPKGVPRTHGAVLDVISQVDGDYGGSQGFRASPAPDRAPPWLIFSPFGHLSGFSAMAYRLWIGRAVVLVERFSVADFATAVHRYRFRTVHLPPAVIYMLATTDLDIDMSSLEYVTSGTSFLSRSTQRTFEDRYHVPILQAYGMSETGTIAADTVADLRAGVPRRIGSVGRASRGVEIRIVDGDADVAVGVDGDIVVRSPAISRRYLGTAAAELDDGWFRTGDVGHLDDDGYLHLLGRKLDRLVVGGLNVYPAEVEEAIRESPLVADVVVVGLADDRLGDLPVAGIVWSADADEARLRDDLRDRLAHYKVPRRWFSLDEVPLTRNNKLDRQRALRIATEQLG